MNDIESIPLNFGSVTRQAGAAGATAATAALATSLALGTAGAASAEAPVDIPAADYGKYVTIDGPTGLEVGGDRGVWTIHAKNPNATADATDHLLFNAFSTDDTEQLRFRIRSGTSGTWTEPQVLWTNAASKGSPPIYRASFDLTGAALDLAPGADQAFQIEAQRLPSQHRTEPFGTSFNAFLTPAPAADGQPGAFTAQAGTGVAPLDLTTTVHDLPTHIPADGRTRQFTVHIGTAHQADWHLGAAGFFLWQGQKIGEMSGPSSCDAELDVLDPATGDWHKVGLGAQGEMDGTVNLDWASGPAYDRTVTARITLGGGFTAAADATIGFGYYPGSGESDYFWTEQKLSTSKVAGAPACAKPGSVQDTPSATPTPAATATTGSSALPDGSTGSQLAATGAGSATGPLAALAAVLVAAGGAVFAAARRRAPRA